MAISESHSTLKVEILCDGVPLQEHVNDDEEDSRTTVTRYIEAESGKNFEIHITLTRPFPTHMVIYHIYLDGKWRSGRFPKDFGYNHQVEDHISGVRYPVDRRWFERKFCFSELDVDDSGRKSASTQLLGALKHMGEIRIAAMAVKNVRDDNDGGAVNQNVSDIGTIPEKALKGRALSHSTSLRPAVPTQPSDNLICDYIDPDKKPFATFTFKYRSRAALRALMIVPRSPSPVPLEERDVETLNPEEMRELLKRQKERDSAAKQVKTERGIKRERTVDTNNTLVGGNDDGQDDDEVSFVSATKRRKLNITVDDAGKETIDLT